MDVFGFSFRNYKFITTGENNENTLITFNVSFSVMGRDYVTDQFVYYVVYDVNKNFVTSETLGVDVDVGFNLVTRLKDGAQIALGVVQFQTLGVVQFQILPQTLMPVLPLVRCRYFCPCRAHFQCALLPATLRLAIYAVRSKSCASIF